MTKVVPYDAKGAVLRFVRLEIGVKNREGAVYVPIPQKLYNNYPNIETYVKFHSESIDTKKAFQMLPNRLQIDH